MAFTEDTTWFIRVRNTIWTFFDFRGVTTWTFHSRKTSWTFEED